MSPRRGILLLVTWLAATALAPDAHAADKSQRALQLGTRVMDELFSSAQFEEARDSLQKAIASCGDCSPQAQATLHGDLAIVLITGLRDQKRGPAEMRKARALDPTYTLDPAFTTPEVQAAYNASASAAGTAGAAGAPAAAGRGPADVVLEDDDDEEKPKKRKHHVVPDDDEDRPPPPPEEPPKPKKHDVFLSFGLVQDFMVLSGQNPCSRGNQLNHSFTCLRPSGAQYHGTPATSGSLSGFALGPTRLGLTSEFALGDSVTAALRVAYAIAGQSTPPDGGKAFFPAAGEVRLSYYFGEALSTKSLGEFLEFAGGMAQLAGSSTVQVHENVSAPRPVNQIDNPETQKLTVYQNAGLGYAAIGAGLFVPLGSATALLADLRLSLYFPTSGFALGLGTGFAFGL